MALKKYISKYLPNLLHGAGSAIAAYSGVIGGVHPLNNPFIGFNYGVSAMLGHQALPQFQSYEKTTVKEKVIALKGVCEGMKSGELYKSFFTVASGIAATITNDLSMTILTAGLSISLIGSEIERRRAKKFLEELLYDV
jgi:hypothetical protein